jgi:DNA-binding HxlR family transcriptional regulator
VTAPRPYGDGCATAHAAELLGERWALLVVRELLLGPKRFADLQRGLPRISPTVLSQRLRELEESGVLRRQRLGPPASAFVYELTDWGHELEPIVIALARWAAKSPSLDRSAELTADALILHMRARYHPRTDAGRHGRFEIQLADDQFTFEVTGDALSIRRGAVAEPDATLATTAPTLAALLRSQLGLEEAHSRDLVRLEGDIEALHNLLQACLFAAADSPTSPSSAQPTTSP